MTQHYHYFVSYCFGQVGRGNSERISLKPYDGINSIREVEKQMTVLLKEQGIGANNPEFVKNGAIVLNYQLLRECTEQSCDPDNGQGEAGD